MRRTHVYIVGAGFSKYAGLPLQKDFTKALLAARADEVHPMQPLIRHLGRFVHDVFDHNESAKAKFWPNLEDVFTNIDLAANTGHHLGPTHSPSRLRTTRRVLLARMMYMLHELYVEAESTKTDDSQKLDNFFKKLDIDQSSFISMLRHPVPVMVYFVVQHYGSRFLDQRRHRGVSLFIRLNIAPAVVSHKYCTLCHNDTQMTRQCRGYLESQVVLRSH